MSSAYMRLNASKSCRRAAAVWHPALLLFAIVLACGGSAEGSTSPDGPGSVLAGLTLSGPINATDTIGARLPQMFVVTLRDDKGRPVVGRAIRFDALRVLTQSYASDSGLPSVSLTTGPDGSVSFGVVLGDIAGPAEIVVQASGSPAYTDTARFTVLPGAAASFSSTPKDTLVSVGKSYTVTSIAYDRKKNAVPRMPDYRPLDASISVSSSGHVTTTSVARSGVVVSMGSSAADTAWVSIVPSGMMALRQGSLVKVVTLDGDRVADVNVPAGSLNPGLPLASPEWTPDGTAFYSSLGFQYDPKPGLYRIDLAGTRTVVASCGGLPGCPQDPTAFEYAGYIASFSLSADGRTIYYSGGSCNYQGILYRAQLGSSAPPVRLSPPNADDCFHTIHRWPSISPDGSTLVFENDSTYFMGQTIQFFDVAARTIKPLRLAGQRPRWSPLGDQVAFMNQLSIWLVRPDGSGLRRLTSVWPYLAGLTWSSDGRWLLAHAAVRGRATAILIDAASGLELPLVFTSGWTDGEGGPPVPVWRPGS